MRAHSKRRCSKKEVKTTNLKREEPVRSEVTRRKQSETG